METLRQSLAILLVFTCLGAGVVWARRKSRRARLAPALLESRGKLALTARHSLHLVRIGDRNLILALHPAGVTFLGDLTPQPPLGDYAPEARREHEACAAISSGATSGVASGVI
jgi:flagellar biogenesis protein FliO